MANPKAHRHVGGYCCRCRTALLPQGVKAFGIGRRNVHTGVVTAARMHHLPGAAAAREEQHVVGPLRDTNLETFTENEVLETPRWGTFCNHTQGDWLGQYGAYAPWDGKPEKIWRDEHGKYVKHVYVRSREERVIDPSSKKDVLVRHQARTTELSKLLSLAIPLNGDNEDRSELDGESLGTVFYDGGSYSTGPEWLVRNTAASTSNSSNGAKAERQRHPKMPKHSSRHNLQYLRDDSLKHRQSKGAEATVSVIEQCLVVSGTRRMRLRVTLKSQHIYTGELDVQVARIVLFIENWWGSEDEQRQAESVAKIPSSFKLEEPCVTLPRLRPSDVTGGWRVFQISSIPVLEENPDSLITEKFWAYTGSTGRYNFEWDGEHHDERGASFCLPAGAFLTLKMIPTDNEVFTRDAIAAKTSSKHSFVVLFGWSPKPNLILTIERFYLPSGQLINVRHSSGKKERQ